MLTDFYFLLFVVIAVYAQVTTGFALTLILLGLVGATQLVALPDAVNAATVITLANAIIFLYRRGGLNLDRLLMAALATSLITTIAGIGILVWLAQAYYEVLRLILGLSIVLCALLLWRAAQPLAQPSSRRAFAWTGALSGLLAGMFAAPGPPLVYLAYRQPWPLARIQESLIFLFGVGALLRLAIVGFSGQFSGQSTHLTWLATPAAVLVTWLAARQPPRIPVHVMKGVVSALLVTSGLITCVSSVQALI